MTLLIFLLKVNITLAVLYLAYRLLLRRLTFHNGNRALLLSAIPLALTIPFVNLAGKAEQVAAPYQYRIVLSQDTTSISSAPGTSVQHWAWYEILIVLYWAGVAIMLLRLLLQLAALRLLHARAQKDEYNGITVQLVNRPIGPFSFFHHIYLPQQPLPDDCIHTVIRHERVHVRQWHSIDIVLGELNRAFNWFNPFAWWLAAAIRENLEFIADRQVIQEGAEMQAYQYSLLHISQSGPANALPHSFSFTHLKIRIIMMNKNRSANRQLVRYPLALLAILISAGTIQLSYGQGRTQSNTKSTPTQLTAAPVPAPEPAPEPPPLPPIPPVPAVNVNITEEPILGEEKPCPVEPAADASGGNPERVQQAQPSPADEKVRITDMNTDKLEISSSSEVAILLEGKEIDGKEVAAIRPDDIASISVLKDKYAQTQYAQYLRDGKKSVILITLKKTKGKNQ